MNAHSYSSVGLAAELLQHAIAELQDTVDSQFVKQHYHRWRDSSVKLSRLRRIRRELIQELEPDARTTSADLREEQAGKQVPHPVQTNFGGV